MQALMVREILNEAVAGDAHYRYILAGWYYEGYEIEANFEEALMWFQLAADGGHHLAQYALGQLHYGGDGVVQNDLEALYWFEQAAKGGHPTAKEMVTFIQNSLNNKKAREGKSFCRHEPSLAPNPPFMNQPIVNQKEKGNLSCHFIVS